MNIYALYHTIPTNNGSSYKETLLGYFDSVDKIRAIFPEAVNVDEEEQPWEGTYFTKIEINKLLVDNPEDYKVKPAKLDPEVEKYIDDLVKMFGAGTVIDADALRDEDED